MALPIAQRLFDRRTVLKGAAAAGALQVASPFIIAARGETPIRIGMVDPFTGVYAAVAQNELVGAKLAVEQINAKGGVLGRPIELLVEDSANDVGTGVQKTRKLIERDQVSFIIGDVNSGIAQAIAQVTAEKKVLHVVSGGHTDSITGKDCKWNVYRRVQHHAHGSEFGDRPAVQQIRQEMALHHAGLCIRPHALRRLRRQPEEARRHHHGQRAHPARDQRFLGLSHQGPRRQSRRPAAAAAGLRHGELPQADRAVRHQQADSRGRDPAGTGIPGSAAARSSHRDLDVRVVLETTQHATPCGVRRRRPQAHRRQGADRPHLVRIYLGPHLRAGGQSREDARCPKARAGARRFRTASGNQAATQQGATTARAITSS